jgi:hypothetical protein
VLLAAYGFIVLDWRCDMKSLATAIVLATVFASPLYAKTLNLAI